MRRLAAGKRRQRRVRQLGGRASGRAAAGAGGADKPAAVGDGAVGQQLDLAA